ncbi:glycosyltransferase family 4 protein [Paenibacillus daejeonensis]|uniref:glycosyltransferase family 4 protein n=1 Tax=Paenibacillus daejeonensis TaxID=135193 RepID=UPI00035C78A4|nr:glycosyltransferase family 4 protein [Paenibacillus daejeonensis]
MNILASGMGWIDHTHGGLNRYFADYTAAMQAKGHAVKGLITAHGERTTAPAYIQEVLSREAKVNPIVRSRAFANKFRYELKASPPDVFNPHFALYASLITRQQVPLEVPIVTHFHGPWAQESQVEDRGASMGQKLRYQLKKNVEQLSYRRSDYFIVLSQYFRDILANEYGVPTNRIHIVPGAVDVDRFRPAVDREEVRRSLGLRPDQPVLFCARRLVNRMGIDRLIAAMPQVLKEAADTVLYIVGDGPLRGRLGEQIEQLGLQQSVTLLGKVSNEDLVRWYQAADLSIVPTVTLEGFGLVTVEALACGTPVLGTPYGGTLEILDQFDRKLLFRDHSPEAIGDKITAVLTGQCTIPSRDACRAHVMQRYTWDIVSESVTQIFEMAVSDRRRLMVR